MADILSNTLALKRKVKLRPEIKEWLKKYCKLHNFRIWGKDVPIEHITRDGRVVPNKRFCERRTKSDKFYSKEFFYWDKIHKAFGYIKGISNGMDDIE